MHIYLEFSSLAVAIASEIKNKNKGITKEIRSGFDRLLFVNIGLLKMRTKNPSFKNTDAKYP